MDIPAWKDGKLQPFDKMAVHRQGLKHPAISVFLMDGDRTLIQRRAAGKYHTPGLWANTCCTHPAWGEAPLDCAVRRLDDELGIKGVTLRPRGQIEYRAKVPPDLIEDEVVQVFAGEVAADTLTVVPNPDEVQQYRWIALPDLHHELKTQPERFTPWLRIYLERHSAQLFGAL